MATVGGVECAVCGKTDVKSLQVCTACKGVFYCNREHQKEHWKVHKPVCKQVQEALTKGYVKEVISKGEEGNIPKKGSTVKVNYVGTLVNGKQFDASSTPFEFKLGAGQVIRGWDEGVATMSVGEKCKLYISPSYAYGSSGVGGRIPPNSPLIFEVEMLSYS